MTAPARPQGLRAGEGAEPGWREVFAVRRPGLVAAVVVSLALATFGYAAVLLVVFDARSWWGSSLWRMAVAFGLAFAVIGALGARRASDRRGLVAFLITSWGAITLVSWLPRQRPPQWPELAQLGWWAGWVVVIYVSVPVAYALVTRQDLRSYGLRLGLFRGEARIFAILLPAILIGAYAAAGQPRFQAVYPFYGEWPDGPGSPAHLVAWWLMYAATFIAHEAVEWLTHRFDLTRVAAVELLECLRGSGSSAGGRSPRWPGRTASSTWTSPSPNWSPACSAASCSGSWPCAPGRSSRACSPM